MERTLININPKVLVWARTEAGYEVSEIASKLEINDSLYSEWERNGHNIPVSKLVKIGNIYKRQLAAFFLPKSPEAKPKPKDFRNLSPFARVLSKKMLNTLRQAYRIKDAAFEIKGSDYWGKKYHWITELSNLKQSVQVNDDRITNWLRSKVRTDISTQIAWNDSRIAYNSFRALIEEHLGILILQFPFPLEEAHGFSLRNGYPYIIVTNSKHAYNGRIFTIFHELAHIFQNEEGICLIDELNNPHREEFDCNEFAGKFLIPDQYVLPADNLEEIKTYANRYKVSRETYIRRLKERGYLDDNSFYSYLEEIKQSYKSIHKDQGFVLPETRSKASRGMTFYNMVIDSVKTASISYSVASQLLDLRIQRLINEL